MTQEHKGTSKKDDEPGADAPPPDAAAQERNDKRNADVDALLDDIDEVLESNSEEFVRGFVQKGGQ